MTDIIFNIGVLINSQISKYERVSRRKEDQLLKLL